MRVSRVFMYTVLLKCISRIMTVLRLPVCMQSYILLLMCTVAIFRFRSVSVIEYLVENQDVKLTYAGKSDGSTILHLACR